MTQPNTALPRKRSVLENHQTLVLNADGLPLGYPFRRLNGHQTFNALALGRVEVYEFSGSSVRSADRGYLLPSVVRMVEQVPEMPLGHPTRLTLRNLYLRDGGRCQYTGEALRIGSPNPDVRATIEHVIPRAQRGKNSWDNVVLASYTQNNRKACQTPEEAGMVLLSQPWIPTVADLLLIWLRTEMLSELPVEWIPFVETDELEESVVMRYPIHPNVQSNLMPAA